MRNTSLQTIDFTNYSVTHVDHATLSSLINSNWVGKLTSTFKIPYMKLLNGKIAVTELPEDFQGNEVLSIAFPNIATANVYSDGHYTLAVLPGIELTGPEIAAIAGIVKTEFAASQRQAHITRQAAFYQTLPWKKVNGLTTAAAVTLLSNLGY